MTLNRGEIWRIKFPYTADLRYPSGKDKYVLILQSGDYFKSYDTVAVLVIDKDDGSSDSYVTNVSIEVGETRLPVRSIIGCSQPYPIKKSLFENGLCKGRLSPEKMKQVDEAIFFGLCIGA